MNYEVQAIHHLNANDLFDDERKQYILKTLKEKMVRELTEQITDGNYYTVRLIPSIHQNFYDVYLKYRWEICAVTQKEITLFNYIDYSKYDWVTLNDTAIKEIRLRIRNKIHSFFRAIQKKISSK